jgi:hypothetical protein
MSDDADISQERQEREDAIRRMYAPANGLEVMATGRCLNCDADVEGEMRWCDKDCQDDWNKRRR